VHYPPEQDTHRYWVGTWAY